MANKTSSTNNTDNYTALQWNATIMSKNLDLELLQNDKKALEKYKQEIEHLIKAPIIGDATYMKDLITSGYYEDFFLLYTEEQVNEAYALAFTHSFEFTSYMAIFKFYNDYAMRSEDKQYYLERYEGRVVANALFLARGDFEQAKQYVRTLMDQYYQPATPTFLNCGKRNRGELISCFLLAPTQDSLNSINYNNGTAMQLSKVGGGVALELSSLRSKGEAIKGIKGVAKGVIPVMKLLEDSFNYADQMGQRKGSGAVYLSIFHDDIEDFLDCKKIAGDEKSRIQTLSTGVIFPDKFMKLQQANKPYYVFKPHSVFEATGKKFEDIDWELDYDSLVADNKVEKRLLDARSMVAKIAVTQLESGYPYIMFSGNANKYNPLKNVGKIYMSNLCSEIFQIQKISNITDYGQPDDIGYDICCNLGSLNIARIMDFSNAIPDPLKEAVLTGMDMLTAVSDLSNIKNAEGVKRANEDFHSVGLGAMNLHGYLASKNIPYESQTAIEFCHAFFMQVNYWSLVQSCTVAQERGITFKYFDQSEYASGAYFHKYTERDFRPRSQQVKDLFGDIQLASKEDWDKLKHRVKEYGLYHSYRMAIAPTQSISYVQNSTQSVMPIDYLIEVRLYGNSNTYYPMPGLADGTAWYGKTAYDMDMNNIIKLVSAIQEHVDQGISCTLFVKPGLDKELGEVGTKELGKLYWRAWRMGLKSIYYVRQRGQGIEECLQCAV